MKVGTQDELLSILNEKGHKLTQATLSRDLKLLKIGKVSDAKKGYVYFLQDSSENRITKENNNAENNFPINGFISLKFSNNLGVIRTKAGYANSIASFIDNHEPYEILGTIAGDDTILIIPQEGAKPKDIKNALILIIPELESRI